MQRMNGAPYSSHQRACVARKDDPLPMQLNQALLVSCQDEFVGWDYHGTGKGQWVMLRCGSESTKEGMALNLPCISFCFPTRLGFLLAPCPSPQAPFHPSVVVYRRLSPAMPLHFLLLAEQSSILTNELDFSVSNR